MIRCVTLFIGALVVLVGAAPGKAQSGYGYTVARGTTVPGGTSTGYGYTVSGAIGQHDAGTAWNEEYQVRGGVWSAPPVRDWIPTVSLWGLIVLALVLLTGTKLKFGRRRPAQG